MPMLAELVDGVIGVDTHRDTLAAAVVSPVGGVLAHTSVPADAAGYRQLYDFAKRAVPGRRCWAVEGAGSFRGWPGRLPDRAGRAGDRDRPAQAASPPPVRQDRRAGRDPRRP
jgi:transposase